MIPRPERPRRGADAGQRTTARLAAAAAAALIAVAAAGTGCATRTDLTPGPAARTPAPEIAVSEVKDVRMVVESDAWPPGQAEAGSHVTPLRIRIENRGARDLRLDHRDFALVAPDGSRYAALPLHDVEGGVTEPVIVGDHQPVFRPVFVHHLFRVAPHVAPIYPDIAPYRGAYRTDPFYVHRYHDYWVRAGLPTETMRRQALPPGVLEPAGYVSGLLYFERVDPGVERVVFRADLVDAEDGRRYGEIRIPFLVRRDVVTP